MIALNFAKGRRYAVMGLGESGLSACKALIKAGAEVLAWDDREASRAQVPEGTILQDLTACDWDGVAALVLAPGIPHTYPEPHPVAAAAIQNDIPIICDVELLAQANPDVITVAITGTNGKSTTTTLIGHILQAHFDKIEVGGNLGKAVLNFKSRNVKVHVVELSSYQLERSPSLCPDVAVLMNISPDHIDRHGDMNGYIAAKKNIFKQGKGCHTAVVSIDDEHSKTICNELQKGEEWDVLEASSQGAVSEGYATQEGRLVFCNKGECHECMDLRGLSRLAGRHNWQNIACAWAAAAAIGVPNTVIAEQIASFKGLQHRQFHVRNINGVSYVNDSKATNAEAASKALQSYNSIYWIAGGLPKDGGLDDTEQFLGNVRQAYVIGESQDEFADWLDKRGIEVSVCGTLDKAVLAAHDQAQADRGLPGGGSVVLLSPACASFDQYPNFEQRGDHFIKLVEKLPDQDEGKA